LARATRQIEAEGELALELIGVTNGFASHWAGVLTSSGLERAGERRPRESWGVKERKKAGEEGKLGKR